MSASGNDFGRHPGGSRPAGAGSDRLSLGHMMDEAARYIGDSDIMSGLGTQIRANPVPLALVGIGLAWMMSGRGLPSFGWIGDEDEGSRPQRSRGKGGKRARNRARGRNRENAGEPTWFDEEGEAGGSWAGSASGALGSVRSGARAAADSVTGVVSSATSGVTSAASAVTHTVADSARYAARTARHGGEYAYSGVSRYGSSAYEGTSSTLADLIDQEPLILGAVGLAVGAAFGAMLPPTEAENRYLGEYSDRLRNEAGEFARTQYERGKAAASQALNNVKDEVQSQGLDPAGLVDKAKDAARDIAQAAVDGAKSGADKG